MSYAVRDFYQNGGGQALIVRLLQANGQSVARVVVSTTSHDSGGTATGAGAPLNLISAMPGAGGNRLRVTIDHETRPHEAGETLATLFNLKLELIPDTGVASLQQLPDLGTGVAEIFTNVSSVAGLPNCLDTVLRNKSKLMRVEDLLRWGAARHWSRKCIIRGQRRGGACIWKFHRQLSDADGSPCTPKGRSV